MEKTLSSQSKKNKNLILQFLFLILVTLVLLVAQIWMHPGTNDDLSYRTVLGEKSLWDFLQDRYLTWSSRVVIEAVMIPLAAANPWVWRVLNIFVILLLVWNTGDLFAIKKEDSLKAQGIFFALTWIIPFGSLFSAGWITTTTNYLWALSFGMLALRPVKHFLLDEKCALWEDILCPICMIYAANMEQMGAILFGIYLVFGIYLLITKKKIPFYHVFLFGLAAASLVFILCAPGNGSRNRQEIERFFPEFADMSLGQKLLMGFLENSHYYISGGHDRVCIVFAVFSAVLLVCFGLREREKNAGKARFWKWCVAAVPFLSYLLFAHVFHFLLYTVHIPRARNLLGVMNENRQVPGQSYFSAPMIGIQVAAYLVVFGCVAVTICFLHGKSKETLLELLILAAGFASRLILGFSPTIYASGDRTALFCSMAILIVTLRNIDWILNKHLV